MLNASYLPSRIGGLATVCQVIVALSSTLALAQDLASLDTPALIKALQGASVVAQNEDKAFLGKFENRFSSSSIFNNYGSYGSTYSSTSIWNTFGTFGSKFSSYSPNYTFRGDPPMIVKNGTVLGFISVRGDQKRAIHPDRIKGLADQF